MWSPILAMYSYIYIYIQKNIYMQDQIPNDPQVYFWYFWWISFRFTKRQINQIPKLGSSAMGQGCIPMVEGCRASSFQTFRRENSLGENFAAEKFWGRNLRWGWFSSMKKNSFFSDSKMFFQLVWKAIPHRFFAGSFFGRFLEMIFINWVAWKNYKKSGLLQRLSMASGFFFAGVWTLSISCV